MADSNQRCGGLCAALPLTLGVLAVAILLSVGGFYAARLLGGKAGGEPAAEDAVVKRIQPVSQIALAGSEPAAATQAAGEAAGGTAAAAAPTETAAAEAAPASAADAGKKVYNGTCMACHAAGVAGAPKFGDKAAWAPRIASGLDTLHHSALKGKGAMPAKGGNPALSDADVAAAVDYMVAAGR